MLNFQFPEDSDNTYTRTTLTTWTVTLDSIRQRENGDKAIELFNIMAYFAPENIPIEMFFNFINSREELGAAIQLLKQYSMVNLGQEQILLNIHRLVQQVIRINLKEQNREKEVLEEALKLFKDIISSVNVDHSISVWSYASKYDQLVKDFSELPIDITDKLNDAIRYKEAYLFGTKVLKSLSNILGPDDENTLNLKFNTAKVLYNQGKFDEALKAFQELECYKFDNIRNTLSIKHNKAMALFKLGCYTEAYNILQDVFKKRKEAFGDNDQETLETQNVMAGVVEKLGKDDEALGIYQDLIEKRKETFGDNDQETLRAKNNKAVILQKLGKDDEALGIYQDVLKSREENFDSNYRETLQVEASIAAEYENQGKYDCALKKYQKVLSKFKQVLGDNHLDTLMVENNIAGLFKKQGKYNDALKTYQEVLDKKTQSFGSSHPTTLITRNNMASVFDEQGDYDKALEIYNEILEKSSDSFFDRGELISTVQDNIEKVLYRKNNEITPLHVAAANDSIERVKLLLKNGAIYNARTKQGKTPLDFAKSDELEKLLNIVKKLFENVKKGNNQQVTLCLEKEKAIVNSRDNDGGGTPLYWAIHNGHMNTARLLLENGADPTLVTNKGNTPLHIASNKGNTKAVKILLAHVKNKYSDKLVQFINTQTTAGETSALHIASNIEVTRSLLQYGAVYNIKNKEGKTPLDLSINDDIRKLLNLTNELFENVKNGEYQVISKLRNLEADDFIAVTNARNDQGHTLLQVAIANKHRDIATELSEMLKNLERAPSSSMESVNVAGPSRSYGNLPS